MSICRVCTKIHRFSFCSHCSHDDTRYLPPCEFFCGCGGCQNVNACVVFCCFYSQVLGVSTESDQIDRHLVRKYSRIESDLVEVDNSEKLVCNRITLLFIKISKITA